MKKFHSVLILTVMICLAAGAALAKREPTAVYTIVQTTPEDLELVAVGTVKEMRKSDQIVLNNGKVYALDNIRVPVHYEQDAKDYLTKSLTGKQVGIFINKYLKNNHNDAVGNLLVHVMTEQAVWVQADLIRKGLAWAFSSPTSRDLVVPLYAYEEAARKNKAGLWRSPEDGIKFDATIEGTEGSFQIYEGIIQAVRPGTGYSYINFGKDPTTDFTLLIKSSDMGLFPKKFEKDLVRSRIRVRGWVEENSGPSMYLTHPEQMQILGKDPLIIKLQPCKEGVKTTKKKPCQEPGQPDTIIVQ